MIVGFIFYYIGDWSNGMIGVSKTFGGSSILSSPVERSVKTLENGGFAGFVLFLTIEGNQKGNHAI